MGIPSFPEALETAMAATLTAYLKGEMDAIWTAEGDGATVPEVQPPQIVAGRRDLWPEYPLVMVVWENGTLVDPGDTTWQGWAHTLTVFTVCVSDDVRVLDQMTKRITWAAVKALSKHQKLNGSLQGVVSVFCGKADRTGPGPSAKYPGVMEQAAAVQVTVRTDELI